MAVRFDHDARERDQAQEQLDDRRPQLRRRRGDGDADHRGGRAGETQPNEEPGLGAASCGRDHDGRRLDAGGRCLPGELDPGEDLAGGSLGTRAADRDQVRPLPRRPEIRDDSRDQCLAVGPCVGLGNMDRRAQQRVESLVGARRVGPRTGQDDVHAKTGLRPCGGRQTTVVRPAAPGRDERVGAGGKGSSDEELEIPKLVATERERQEVLALDPDVGPATQRGREPRQRAER